MEDFNIMNEKKNNLEPIIEELYLLCYTKTTFSQIEKDILLQHLREAYMAILSMQTDECAEKGEMEREVEKAEEKRVKKEEDNIVKEVVFEEKKEEVIENDILEDDIVEENVVEENVVEEEIIEEVVIEENVIKEDVIEENIIEEDVIKENVSEYKEIIVKEEEIPFIEESVTTPPKRSLNDLFTEKREERSLNARFQNEKITDLTKSISINDKFLFIRELFNNKGEEFSRSLHILNHCKDIESAFEEMENMKKNYYWDSTSSAYLKLCDLIRRKF